MKRLAIAAAAAVLALSACGGSTVTIEPVDSYQCIMDKWDAGVGEWNVLIETSPATNGVLDNGVNYETYEDWASFKGYPENYEEAEVLFAEECS